MTDPLVSMDNLTVRFDERPVVDRVNLTVHRGDIITIIGPNGAGKTTLIKAILGIEKVSEGQVSLGKNLIIGYVPQHLTLEPTLPLSVKRFMLLSGRSLSECESALGHTGIAHLLDASVHHLSGGEKQRVAIGRALLSSPTALLMDEPLANLDLLRRREILPFIERLKDRFQLPILYVSHNLDETIRLADQVLIMRAGRIVASGPTEETLSRIEVQSILFGENQSPEPLTIVSGHIAERHPDGLVCIETPWGRIVAPNVEGKIGHRLRLRIRARDIILSKREPSDLSIRNTIEGEIGLMAEAGDSQVDVLVRPNGNPDSPVTPALWARITKHAAADLSLTPGTKVWALLKAVVLATDIDLDALN